MNEKLANETAEGFTKVNAEMVTIWTVAMQNRITLDVLLAEQGDTCAVIGSECCTEIPNNSEEIDNLAGKIKAEGAKYHDSNKGWNFGSSLDKMFGGWGAWMLHILFIGLIMFIAIVVIIACIRAIIGVCEKICHSNNNGGA